jgi:hypothetical protein
MSELNFFESTDIPQPRDKIKIESVDAQPYPDGWRVKLVIRVTPFQERPSLEIAIDTITGGLSSPVGSYLVKTELYYEDRTKVQDQHETSFSVEAA